MAATSHPPVLHNGGFVLIPPDARVEIRTVPISQITLPDVYCRLDLDHVVELCAKLSNRLLPPVLLLEWEHGYWLVEGRHRFVTAIVAGRDVVLAVVSDRIEIVR